MFTVLFASIGSFVDEISCSIIKYETNRKKESIYTAGFINALFGILILLALALFRNSFVFSLASLPTFSLRAFLEIVQLNVTMLAIMKADRSTFSFVRNLTIPLLLITDLILGFTIGTGQWIGILIILVALGIILAFRIINTKGIGYTLFTSVNAVATISLYKYNITHFNSVEGEQIMIYVILLIYFFLAARFIMKENPFVFLRNKMIFSQGVTHSIASVLQAFAVSFGNPGIAIAAKRASAVLAGIFAGHNYFHEKKFGAKILVAGALIIGLILLAV